MRGETDHVLSSLMEPTAETRMNIVKHIIVNEPYMKVGCLLGEGLFVLESNPLFFNSFRADIRRQDV